MARERERRGLGVLVEALGMHEPPRHIPTEEAPRRSAAAVRQPREPARDEARLRDRPLRIPREARSDGVRNRLVGEMLQQFPAGAVVLVGCERGADGGEILPVEVEQSEERFRQDEDRLRPVERGGEFARERAGGLAREAVVADLQKNRQQRLEPVPQVGEVDGQIEGGGVAFERFERLPERLGPTGMDVGAVIVVPRQECSRPVAAALDEGPQKLPRARGAGLERPDDLLPGPTQFGRGRPAARPAGLVVDAIFLRGLLFWSLPAPGAAPFRNARILRP